ncbi:MAG TPA: hypothetical protein VNS58_02350 [Puia sp.]|nr:hypothetical protein [Puia sp.]
MTQIPYSYTLESSHRYTFVSTGKINIIKAVDFSPVGIDNLYNLGFGDLLPDGSLDVDVKSNNGDILKVLTTVVQITRDFTAQFPGIELFFIGSTAERTKLYARILKMYYNEFRKEFIIRGLIVSGESYIEVPFDPQTAFEYFAFLIKKIE